MSALFEILDDKNNVGETKVLTASGEHGLIEQQSFFNKNVASQDLQRYYLLKKGDFAYNRSAMKGYPVGATKRLDRYEQAVVSPLYLCFRPRNSAHVSSDFYAQYFESGLMNAGLYMIAAVGGRAHGLLNVKTEDFMSLEILLPPLPEQRKIAEILSSVDDLIEKTERLIAKLKEVKKAMLQELLTNGIGHTRFKDSPVGRIPEEWEVVRLGDVVSEPIRNGHSPVPSPQPTDHLIFHLGAVTDSGLNPAATKFSPPDPKVAANLLRPMDLLVSRSNTRERVGFAGVYRGHPPRCSFPDLLMRVRLQDPAGTEFLEIVLLSPIGRSYFESHARGTSGTMVKINAEILADILIPRPEPFERDRIVAVIGGMQQRIDRLGQRHLSLTGLKNGLMQDLLTGKVRVKV